jgi:penicillin amidase
MRRPLAAALVCLLAAAFAPAAPAGAQSAPSEIRIVRDRFGVPHVFGPTAEDVSYGAGYALAQDRLWQMHVFRLIGKGELSHLLGPLVIDIDKEVRFFTYTEAERQARFDGLPPDIKANLQAFADGINAWIDRAQTDPSVLPFEFVEYGEPVIRPWTVTDSVALSDVLILSFGSGGGNEVTYAALLKSLVERFGANRGLTAFNDLVVTEEPDGPISIPRNYKYQRFATAARVAEAESRRGLEDDARLGLEPAGSSMEAAPAAASPAAVGTLEQLALIPDPVKPLRDFRRVNSLLERLRRMFSFGSNAQIVGARMSEAGNAAQTGGPQVGYLMPQWLADFGLHSADGKLDATGMTFAGAGPAVLIGRGRGFAWTTTTGASDLTDTYIEKLNPDDPRQYLWNGTYEDMDCRTETYALRGVPFDEQEICRTRHGPVVSFDEANGVAYAIRYAWFNREHQTVEGFFRYNQARSIQDFATYASYLGSNHNMFYTDDRGNYGYWHPGNHPVRARGVDLRLPQDGTGGSEWRGLLPIQRVPHAVNFKRGWLVNWNNQPALGWKRERAYGVIDNAQDLENALDPGGPVLRDPFGGRLNPDKRVDFDDLTANLRYGAFKHHRDTFFRPFLPADSALKTDLAKAAAGHLRAWDGFLTDADEDGLYHSGRTIVDRWASVMRTAAFSDDLGDLAGEANESLLWHLLNPRDRLQQRFDWLNGKPVRQFAAEAFEAAVAELAAEFEDDDPATWQQEVSEEHYQRLNADLFADTIFAEAGLDNSDDLGTPGDVQDIIKMDRGTYNHVVVYLSRPRPSGAIGRGASKAGSVIPPGQSGFVNLAGQEGDHYEDQLALYLEWRFKPMPTTLAEALAVMESEETLTRE